MNKNDRSGGGADVHAPRADETGGEVSPTRPDTVDGWPVKWERRGRADDGRYTIDGMTAVVDQSRCGPATLRLTIERGRPIDFQVHDGELDRQPVDALDSVVDALVRDMDLRWELVR